MIVEPFDPDIHEPHAIVREEDVQLILTPDSAPRPTAESLRALESAALRATGERPGGVVVRPGRPMVLLAIIHDLGREPSWTEEWIAAATRAALRAAWQRGLTRIAMPLPGTVHGRVPAARAAELLGDALRENPRWQPEHLWVEDSEAALIRYLRTCID